MSVLAEAGAFDSQWLTGQDAMRIIKQRLLEMIPDLHIFLASNSPFDCLLIAS